MGDACLFCRVVSNQIPSSKVYEDESVLVIKDIHPQAPTHLLFLPKTHVDSLEHIPDPAFLNPLFAAVLKVTKSHGLEGKGYRTIINTGREGGQTVFHLHIHVLSGKKLSEQMA